MPATVFHSPLTSGSVIRDSVPVPYETSLILSGHVREKRYNQPFVTVYMDLDRPWRELACNACIAHVKVGPHRACIAHIKTSISAYISLLYILVI
jgi:hypothetical protein